jgi:hypothetical protein
MSLSVVPLAPAEVRTSRRTKRRLLTAAMALCFPRAGDVRKGGLGVILLTVDLAGRFLLVNLTGVSVSSSIKP